MADKIRIDTQLLDQLSSQITQLERSLYTVNDKVLGSISEVRRVASGQTGTINKLTNVQRNIVRTAERAGKLAKATRNAATNWEEAENRVTNQKLPETDNSADNSGGGGYADWKSNFTDILKRRWDPKKLFGLLDNQPHSFFEIWSRLVNGGKPGGLHIPTDWPRMVDVLPPYIYLPSLVIGSAFAGKPASSVVSTLFNVAAGPALGPVLYNVFTDKVSGSGALVSGKVESGGAYAQGELIGGSFKTKGSASWDLASGKVGVKQSISAEGHLAQGEAGYKGKYGEVSGKVTVGGASASGEVGATLFEDGKFNPSIYAKAKGEVYAAKGEVSGKLGTDDVNAYGSAEGTLFGAEGEAKVGYSDGKFSAKAGGEAYIAKGEVKGGFELFGIKIGASGEAMVGVNATAGGEVGASGASGEVGIGPFKVKLSIDWSGFAKKYL